MRRIGKIGQLNRKANVKLKRLYEDLGRTRCEVGLVIGNSDCTGSEMLSFAHRHKRIEYRKDPNKLSSYMETVVCCIPCHQIIEKNSKLTEKVFNILRPNDKS